MHERGEPGQSHDRIGMYKLKGVCWVGLHTQQSLLGWLLQSGLLGHHSLRPRVGMHLHDASTLFRNVRNR